MILIADSSALITLAICDSLECLEKLFGEVKVPQAVYEEVTHDAKPEAKKLRGFLIGKVIPVDKKDFPIEMEFLGSGEIEAMILYEKLNADWLLIDDERAKRKAKSKSINTIGSMGVLVIAKEKKIINEIKPLIEKIKNSNIYLSNELIQRILISVEETV